MTPQQQFRRMLWEDYYSKLEFRPIANYEIGMAEINRVAAKFDCPQLALSKSPVLAFKIADQIYEASKERTSLYRKLGLDIYPDHDSFGTVVSLTLDLPRGSISVDVKDNGQGAFTLIVKHRQHQSSVADKYSTPVVLHQLFNTELKNVAQTALDSIANELRG